MGAGRSGSAAQCVSGGGGGRGGVKKLRFRS